MKLALALLLVSASVRANPLEAAEAAWRAKGYSVKDRISAENAGLKASAALYAPGGEGGDRLELHVVVKDRAFLGYTHPSSVDRLEFDPSPAGRFADLFHDGSLALAYRSTRVSVGATDLNVLRWSRFRIERVAVFPEGRFVRLPGGDVVASRELPLGRYLSMGCEDFGTISRTAFKTTLNAPRGGVFVDVSSEHPDYYRAEIGRKEKVMASLKKELQKNAGEYLGIAISTYYDYAALKRAREGWSRLREFFKLPALAPAAAKTCMASMEKELRSQLKVPASWP